MKMYRQNLIKKISFAFFLFFSLAWLSLIQANISNSFPSSLTHQGSGQYKWSTWDYLTTPYIYHLEKKNAVSATFTPNFLGGAYGAAVKYTIPGIPVLDKLPWAVALSIKNNGRRVDFQEQEISNAGYLETFDRDIRFMIGTTLSELIGINLGMAFYLRNGIFHYNEKIREGDPEEIGSLVNETSFTPVNWRGNIYGVELGQFYELQSSKNSWAWSLSIEYADLGTKSETGSFASDAPRLRIFNKFSNILENTYSVKNNGKKRQEVNIALIDWFPAGYSADVGTEVRLNIPFGSGQDIRIAGDDRTIDDVTIDGFGITGALFYDKDFHIDPKDDRSVFRIQPIVTFTYAKEDVNYSPSGQRFGFEDSNVSIGVSFKIVYYATQKFYLMLGWNPFLRLHSVFREEYLPPENADNSDTERTLAFSEIEDPPGRTLLGAYSVAIGYDFTESMSAYFLFGNLSASGSVVPSSEDPISGGELRRIQIRNDLEAGGSSFIDLISKITFGIDYRF